MAVQPVAVPVTITSYVWLRLCRQLPGAVHSTRVWPRVLVVTCTFDAASGAAGIAIVVESELVYSPGSPSARTTTGTALSGVPVIVHVVRAEFVQPPTGEPLTYTVYVLLVLPLKSGSSQVIVAEPLAHAVAWMLVGGPGAGSRLRLACSDGVDSVPASSPIAVTTTATDCASAVMSHVVAVMLTQPVAGLLSTVTV